jgi:hypothetical protein
MTVTHQRTSRKNNEKIEVFDELQPETVTEEEHGGTRRE